MLTIKKRRTLRRVVYILIIVLLIILFVLIYNKLDPNTGWYKTL